MSARSNWNGRRGLIRPWVVSRDIEAVRGVETREVSHGTVVVVRQEPGAGPCAILTSQLPLRKCGAMRQGRVGLGLSWQSREAFVRRCS